MTKKDTEHLLGEKLNSNLNQFLRHTDSIRDILPMFILLISPYTKKSLLAFDNFLKNNVKEIKKDKEQITLLVKANESHLFETLEKNASISKLAIKIVPESLFVSLISQYDAYLNRLLKILFEIKPEILNSSDRNITFSQLVEYKNIKNARDCIIEKEIETVLRKSHSEQFNYLEKISGIELRKELPMWKTFVEITERRNLFVHCDGKISSQYINNCNLKNDKNYAIGERLKVSPEYFNLAYKCLYEISVKLTHTLWRKFISSDLKNADFELNQICYNLIDNKSYELADILLQFAHEQKKKFNNNTEITFIINFALSKHLDNKQKEAEEILNKRDWSACSDEFKLAFEIINENHKAVYHLMKKIGKSGIVDKEEYKSWPLFKKIREQKEFKKIYKEIFKENYSVMEMPDRPLLELIEKYEKENPKKTLKKIKSISPKNKK